MDLRKAIEEATGEPVVWKPEAGEYLIGKVLAVRDIETDMGSGRLAEIEDEDSGAVKTLFLTTMLKERFLEYGIGPGDRIAVKYHGKRTNAKGREYHHWTVFVDRSAPVGSSQPEAEVPKEGVPEVFGEDLDDDKIPF